MADLFGVSRRAVWNVERRALKKLRAALAEYAELPPAESVRLIARGGPAGVGEYRGTNERLRR